jgi:hypothetical protein
MNMAQGKKIVPSAADLALLWESLCGCAEIIILRLAKLASQPISQASHTQDAGTNRPSIVSQDIIRAGRVARWALESAKTNCRSTA